MALIDTIATTATVLTIFSFLTGLLICRNIYRVNSTKDFSSFTFLAGVTCTYLWLRYGLLLNDPTMIFVNSIGFCLQALYLSWFYIYTVSKSQINGRIALLLSFLFSVHLYSRYWSEPDALVGSLACVSSLIFCASPLASVSEVIRTKCTEKLPFSLILSSFMVSVMWFTYGFLLGDTFVQFPNAIGALITAVQLSLFVIYPSKRHAEARYKLISTIFSLFSLGNWKCKFVDKKKKRQSMIELMTDDEEIDDEIRIDSMLNDDDRIDDDKHSLIQNGGDQRDGDGPSDTLKAHSPFHWEPIEQV